MFSFEPLVQEHFVPLLADASIKVTFLLALTALVALLARRVSATTRHGIWMLGLVVSMCLPLLGQALPRLPLPLPGQLVPTAPAASRQPEPRRSTVSPAATEKNTLPEDIAPGSVAQTSVAAPPAMLSRAAELPFFTPTTALLLLWLGGVGVVLAQWLVGIVGLRRLLRATRAVPADAGTSSARAFNLAERALPGKHGPTQLRIASSPDVVRTPLTWGWRRPVIVLPSDADAWSAERLHAVLLHELAHIRRRDWACQRLAQLACAVFWFHPLVWIAARAARLESENASDDLVLAAGLPAPDYARHLLDTARFVRRAPLSRPQGAIAMIPPRPSELETRLRTILSPNQSRRPLGKKQVRLAIAAAVLLALPVAALRPIVKAQDSAAGPGVLVRKIDGVTQYVSSDLVRAVSADDKAGGRVIEYDLAARKNAPFKTVPGYKATLPNGTTVEIVGLVRLRAHDGHWQYDAFNAWQSPDGRRLAAPIPNQIMQSGQEVSLTKDAVPVLIVTRVVGPAKTTKTKLDLYHQVMGQEPDVEYSWSPAHVHLDDLPRRSLNNLLNTYALFPRNAKTFAMRSGVAAGPWHTQTVKPVSFTPQRVKTEGPKGHKGAKYRFDVLVKLDDRPSVEYSDKQDKWHVEYFLPEGQRLGADDRRIVAVDKAGREFPLEAGKMGGGLRQFGAPMAAMSFVPSTDPDATATSTIRLAQIKELRLQTRPFQRVEFQNIQIPPQPVQ